MPKIQCDMDECRYCKHEECKADDIEICTGVCITYEEKKKHRKRKKNTGPRECKYCIRPGVCGGMTEALCRYMNYIEPTLPGQPPRSELHGFEVWCDDPNVVRPGDADKTEDK